MQFIKTHFKVIVVTFICAFCVGVMTIETILLLDLAKTLNQHKTAILSTTNKTDEVIKFINDQLTAARAQGQ